MNWRIVENYCLTHCPFVNSVQQDKRFKSCSQGQSEIQELTKAGRACEPSYMEEKPEKQKEMQQWDRSPCTVLSKCFSLKLVELIYNVLAEVVFALVQSPHVLFQVTIEPWWTSRAKWDRLCLKQYLTCLLPTPFLRGITQGSSWIKTGFWTVAIVSSCCVQGCKQRSLIFIPPGLSGQKYA